MLVRRLLRVPSRSKAKLLVAGEATRSYDLSVYVRLLLLTAMRSDREALNVQWRHVAFGNQLLTLAQSKTAAGEGRVIPMNDELHELLAGHADRHRQRSGAVNPDHRLFPRRKPAPADPCKHVGSFKKALLDGLRAGRRRSAHVRHPPHDVGQAGRVGGQRLDHTIMAIAGHLSRRMLERYSHIRMQAKRAATELVRSPSGLMGGVRTAVPEKVPTASGRPTSVCSQPILIQRPGG